MGISTASKRIGVQHIVAIANLKEKGKLPQGPFYDLIVKDVLPQLSDKLDLANQMLLQEKKFQASL